MLRQTITQHQGAPSANCETEADSFLFESLVAQISNRFINVDPDKLTLEIDGALAAVGEVMGADRDLLFARSEDGTHHRIARLWTAGGIAPDYHQRPELADGVISTTGML